MPGWATMPAWPSGRRATAGGDDRCLFAFIHTNNSQPPGKRIDPSKIIR
jgi:hypothetical protein